MNGAKLRERLSKGEAITMFNPHHVSPGLSARLVELGADSIFVDCEHGAWGFEDVRNAAQVIRGAGGAAIVRPDSHQRSLLIRYLNAGADGLMVPMVDTAGQARAIVDAVRYACPADHEKRLIVSMVETLEAIGNIDELLAVVTQPQLLDERPARVSHDLGGAADLDVVVRRLGVGKRRHTIVVDEGVVGAARNRGRLGERLEQAIRRMGGPARQAG